MKRALVSLLFFSFILFLLYLPLGMSTGVWLSCNSANVGKTKTMGTKTYWCCYVNGNYQWQTSACDTTPPSTSISPDGKSWTNADVSFTLTCSDSGSGCAETRYSIISSTSSCPSYSNLANIGTSGTVTCASNNACQLAVCYASKDNAGNIENVHKSNTFYIDKIAPTGDISHSPSSPTSNDQVTYTATGSDSNSGLSKIEIYVDSSLKKTCTSSPCSYTEGPYSAGSSHSYYAKIYDVAGNVYTTSTKSFTVGQASISLTSSATQIDVTQTSTITASTSDGRSGVTITFSTNLGSLSSSSCTTGSDGKCSVTYYPPSSQGGLATITGSATNYNSGSTQVSIFDFSISVSPSSGSVTQGQSTTTTVSTTLTYNPTRSVSFSCSNLPSGASCSFSPASCNPSCSSTLTISTSSTTPTGTYTITITATGGGLTRSATYSLSVTSTTTSSTTTSTTTSSTTTTTTTKPSCSSNSDCRAIDTDGGKNIYRAGTCSWTYCSESTHTCQEYQRDSDSCKGEERVEELYPDPDTPNRCKYEDIPCPSGYKCSNGACVPVTTTSTSTTTTTPGKPDLVITDIWFGSDGKVHYTIKNQGNANAAVSYSWLYADGSWKDSDSVPELSAGTSSYEYFSYWTCSGGASYSIKVCADVYDYVSESNENNNCMTKTLTCPTTGTTTTTTQPTITLTAYPQSVPADGTSQSTVTAWLNPPKAGVKVGFARTICKVSSDHCYTGSDGSCAIYVTSTEVGNCDITATAQGYSSGYTFVTFTAPPASVVVSVGQRYISPGQNLTVTVYIKSNDYKFGKDVSLDIKLDGKDWSIFDDKKLVADIGWSYSCDGKHEGMYGKWKCDSSGCHHSYSGWPITVDSKSSEHWIRITFTYQLPANIPPGTHTITVTPTLHSTPIRLASASTTIYVVPKTIFDPVIILIRDLLKALLG